MPYVNCATPEPSAFMVHICGVLGDVGRYETKAIFEPSGDHTGWVSDAPFQVRLVTPAPSAPME